jgi:hypothetical protein
MMKTTRKHATLEAQTTEGGDPDLLFFPMERVVGTQQEIYWLRPGLEVPMEGLCPRMRL